MNCSRFDACSAPLCPLDPQILSREYLDGESICYYMRQYALGKTRTIPDHILNPIGRYYIPLKTRIGPLKKRLERRYEARSGLREVA